MKRLTVSSFVLLLGLALVLAPALVSASKAPRQKDQVQSFTLVQLEGGRRLDFVRAISSEREIHPKRSFWNKLLDFVAGEPEWHRLIRPYSVITDSRGRVIVSDPGAMAVHVFDFENKKYWFLQGSNRQALQSPIGVAVDAQDNIYVADSRLGKIFVFSPDGKFSRYIGDAKGEGYFKRPTGLAIDRREGRLYVADTLRDRIYVTDLQGSVLHHFGGRGSDPGQFNFPTEVVLHDDEVLVVDTMNFRVQIFDHTGTFRAQFGRAGDSVGTLFRPKGLGFDSEGNIYLVDASLETVQVFNRAGRLLYAFGRTGTEPGQFELPSGLFIDSRDRIFVADSYNRRIQEFKFTTVSRVGGGQQE